jgi:glycosyltransferase 2 family protein
MIKRNKIILGLLVSVGLILFLLYKIDIQAVEKSISHFKFNLLWLVVVQYLFGIGLRCHRWQLLLKQRKKVNNGLVFRAYMIGYMINNLLPAKVGELARMEYVKRRKGMGRSFLLGTIFIERLIDVLIVLIIFALSVIFSQTIRNAVHENQWILYCIAVILIISFVLMLKPSSFNRFLHLIPQKYRKRFETGVTSFTDAAKFIKNGKLILSVSISSIMIWCLTLLSAFTILWGLGIILPIHAYLFLIAAGVLSVVIPSTSGGIGVYHAVATAALILFNVAPDKALAYAVIAHGVDFVPGVMIGGGCYLYDLMYNHKNYPSEKISDEKH